MPDLKGQLTKKLKEITPYPSGLTFFAEGMVLILTSLQDKVVELQALSIV